MAEINITGNTAQVAEDLASIKESVKEINEAGDNNNQTTEETNTKWTELNSKVELFKTGLTSVWEIGTELYGTVKDLVSEFEAINNQMTILKSQKGSGEIILQMEELEQATNGVVGKFEVLESVNKAMSFGIDLTGGRLKSLVGIASKAASTMGTTLKDAFDSLIVGTARESKMILDNLGVMVDTVKANEDYAKSLGKTSAELTDVESKTALLNQVIERLGRTQGSIIDEELLSAGTGLFARMERGWKMVKMAVGEAGSEFLQWVDDLGRSEESLEKIKYSNMLGDVRDFYERKTALEKKDLDEETKKYLETHQLMTAEEKADYIRSQNKKRIQIEESTQEARMNELKASSFNNLILNELIKRGQVSEFYVDQERQRRDALEAGLEYEGVIENYRYLNNKGIHQMYVEDIKAGLNESQAAMLQYYHDKGMLIDADLLLFKGRTMDGIDFALKSLKQFAAEATTQALSGKWGKSAVQIMFGLDANDFAKMQEEVGVKSLWKKLLDEKKKIDKDANKDAKKLNDEAYKQEEKHLDNMIKLQEKQLKKEADLFNKSRQRDIDNMVKLSDIEIKHDMKTSTDKIDRQKYVDDLTAEMNTKAFDAKWQKMIDFETKYNTDLGISGKKLDEMSKKELDERLKNEEQYYEVKNEMAEMSLRASAEFTSMLINDVLLGEKEFRKEMIGDFIKGIGNQMVADGTFHIFSGIAKGWSGNAAGWAEAKAGAVEVGVGVGLGATSKAIGTSGSGSEAKSKETASADRINNNNSGRDQMQVYLYPSEKYYLRTHNRANKKLGYNKK